MKNEIRKTAATGLKVGDRIQHVYSPYVYDVTHVGEISGAVTAQNSELEQTIFVDKDDLVQHWLKIEKSAYELAAEGRKNCNPLLYLLIAKLGKKETSTVDDMLFTRLADYLGL